MNFVILKSSIICRLATDSSLVSRKHSIIRQYRNPKLGKN